MADDLKPPVAIRITRPYATDAEFLEREFDTLTHTSVVLLGAQARPQGVVLRFEIVLSTGESVLRGEGRVVGYKERAHSGEPGLTLRFTRLDSRSKGIVDRAASLREARVRASTSLMSMPAVVVPRPMPVHAAPPLPAPEAPPKAAPSPPRRPSTAPPPPVRMPSRGPPPLPEWAKAAVPPPPSVPIDIDVDVESTQVDSNFDPFPKAFPADPPSPIAAQVAPFEIALPPPEQAAPSPDDAPRLTGHDDSPGLLETPEPTPIAAPVVAMPPVAPAKPAIRPTPARPPPLPRPVTRIAARSPAEPSPSPTRAIARAQRTPLNAERPANRDVLLARLRTRAASLPASRIQEILAKRR